jgi:hypothetical protein
MMLDDKVHDLLFSETTLKIGEIHWMLLKSVCEMDRKRWEVKKEKIGSTHEPTQFGKEVGMDEIHWWVFEREKDVDELFATTEDVLESVQALKNASTRLNNKEPKSYEQLLLTLKNFADRHRADIESFHAYIGWLMKRDVMAPGILFTYRVWGSSRMSDRYMEIAHEETLGCDMNKLRTLTEIALGVRNGGYLVYDTVHMEIGFDIFDGLDPQQISDEIEIVVPEDQVIRRTAYAVYGNCVTYFTQLRDSLRNVLLDTEKFKEQRALFHSDEFWREFITKARNAKTSETQLWDFKETLTIWHVKNDPARGEAKVNFAEDVASFANSSGGVLIVGVSDKRDILGVGVGRELENRLKVAADIIAEHVCYTREIASFRQVVMGEAGTETVCLVVVISQACEPVAVIDPLKRYFYPVRRETGTSRVQIDDVSAQKLHLKSDNRDFMHQLRQFIKDN